MAWIDSKGRRGLKPTSRPEIKRRCFSGIVVISLEQKDIGMAPVTHDRIVELNVHNSDTIRFDHDLALDIVLELGAARRTFQIGCLRDHSRLAVVPSQHEFALQRPGPSSQGLTRSVFMYEDEER
jgi:hypothetical protein